MINPIYSALTTPQNPVPGCGPQDKQALISGHGGPAARLGRLRPDPRKQHFLQLTGEQWNRDSEGLLDPRPQRFARLTRQIPKQAGLNSVPALLQAGSCTSCISKTYLNNSIILQKKGGKQLQNIISIFFHRL